MVFGYFWWQQNPADRISINDNQNLRGQVLAANYAGQ